MVSLIVDLIAVALIITIVIVSARKGFLSGFVSFVGWLVSAFVANTFCTVIADYLYLNFIKSRIYNVVFNAVSNRSSSLSSTYSDLFESLPEALRTLLGSADPEALNTIFSDPQRTIESISLQITDDVIGPVVMTLLVALSFIVIFLLCMLVVKLLANLFKGVRKIPIIGPINTFFGGVIGVAEAIIIIYVIKIVFEFVITAAGGNLFGLVPEDFSNSYVFKIFDFNFRGLL